MPLLQLPKESNPDFSGSEQPRGDFELDLEHPLVKEGVLQFLYYDFGYEVHAWAGRRKLDPDQITHSVNGIEGQIKGLFGKYDTDDSVVIIADQPEFNTQAPTGTGEVHFGALMMRDAVSESDAMAIVNKSSANGENWAIQQSGNSQTNANAPVRRTTGASLDQTLSSMPASGSSDGVYFLASKSWANSDTTGLAYVDAVLVNIGALPASRAIGYDPGAGIHIGRNNGAGINEFQGAIPMVFCFNRRLIPEVELRRIIERPWDFLRPKSQPVYFTPVAAPSGNIITATQAEAGDTQSASLEVIVEISANQTEAGDTQAASIQVPAQITANQTEAGDVTAANIQNVVSITAAQQEAGDTQVAQISPIVQIAANQAEDGDTQVAAISNVVSITANQQEAGDTQVAAIDATDVINITANQLEAGDVQLGNIHVIINITANQLEAGDVTVALINAGGIVVGEVVVGAMSTEPTAVIGRISSAETTVLGIISDEPTAVVGIMSDEPTAVTGRMDTQATAV